MHQIYASMKIVGPKNSEVFMQVPCNESIKAMIRYKVLNQGTTESLRKKVESKYAV